MKKNYDHSVFPASGNRLVHQDGCNWKPLINRIDGENPRVNRLLINVGNVACNTGVSFTEIQKN